MYMVLVHFNSGQQESFSSKSFNLFLCITLKFQDFIFMKIFVHEIELKIQCLLSVLCSAFSRDRRLVLSPFAQHFGVMNWLYLEILVAIIVATGLFPPKFLKFKIDIVFAQLDNNKSYVH